MASSTQRTQILFKRLIAAFMFSVAMALAFSQAKVYAANVTGVAAAPAEAGCDPAVEVASY